MDSVIGQKIGGCLIECSIGQGGMGIVYKAHHLALDIPVALKLLYPLLLLPNSGHVDRFQREARVAARLRNPNIVGVLNVGNEGGRHFIIMEYIEGCNLFTLTKQEGKLGISPAIEIACQALDGLDCMFRHSIVHRDIKPENILLDRDGRVKLTDCGLARLMTDTTITQSSIMMGSPYYIAPEQAENSRNADHRADIYSLGCTLFYLLSGRPPFLGETPIEIILNHLRKEPPLLRDIDPSIPPALSSIVRKMMDKRPENRPQTPLKAKAELCAAVPGGAQSPAVLSSLVRKLPVNLPEHRPQALIETRIEHYPNVLRDTLSPAALPSIPPEHRPQPPPGTKVELHPDVSSGAQTSRTTTIKTHIFPAFKKFRFVYVTAAVLMATVIIAGLGTIPGIRKQKKSPFPPVAVTGVQQEKPSARDESQTLIREIQKGNIDRVQTLLNSGTDPNSGDIPPLIIAVQSNGEFIGHILCKKGSNPNRTDPSGRTALHYALYAKNTSFIRLLLAFGADPNKLDPTGKSPLDLAQNPNVEALLRRHGAK